MRACAWRFLKGKQRGCGAGECKGKGVGMDNMVRGRNIPWQARGCCRGVLGAL